MTDAQELRNALDEVAQDGRAGCKALLDLAERLGVSPAELGKACNELGIRIRACQLGCFK